MARIVVTGIAGAVGARLLPLLAGDEIVGVDVRAPRHQPPNLRMIRGDLTTARLDAITEGADAIVHLAWTVPAPRAQPRKSPQANVTATRRLLQAADRTAVGQLVHLSSAVVYGAWADNAVPLSEETALRPNPGIADAVARAEAERMVAEWADAHPGAPVAVLRTATVLGPGVDSWVARALAGRAAVRPDQADPLRQFVHVDDVASAVAHALRARLDGTFNVAPDSPIAGEVLRGMTAGGPSLPVPGRFAAVVGRWAWTLRLTDLPPALSPLVVQPWVVANDRLRATGWAPQYTSEEAIVAGRPGSWWREMGPARRQRLVLAGAGTVVAGGAAGIAAAVRRGRRR